MENKSEREDHDDVGDQSDGAEESTPEMKIVDIDTLVSEGCVCSNENYFSVLVAQTIVAIQHQVCEEISRNKDVFLLGMLTTGQHKEETTDARHSTSATPRDCIIVAVHCEGTKGVQKRVLCYMWNWSHSSELTATTCLWWNMHADVGKVPWNKYSLAARERAVEFITVLPRLSVPRLSETSIIRTQFRTWSLYKKNGILTKIADSVTEQRTCVCKSHVHVQCRHTVVRHRVHVQCGHTVVRHRVQCEV